MRAVTLSALVLVPGCASPEVGQAPEARVVFDPGYEQWLPQGSPDGDEYKRGNVLGMTVDWIGPAGLDVARVTLRLLPSRRAGSALNSGGDTLPDFFLERSLNPGWAFGEDYTPKIPDVQLLEASIVLPPGEKARAVISCFDWGGTFRVEARAEAVRP